MFGGTLHHPGVLLREGSGENKDAEILQKGGGKGFIRVDPLHPRGQQFGRHRRTQGPFPELFVIEGIGEAAFADFEEGEGENEAAHRIDAENRYGLLDRADLIGESVVGAVDHLQHLRREGDILGDQSSDFADVRIRPARDPHQLRSHRRQRRQVLRTHHGFQYLLAGHGSSIGWQARALAARQRRSSPIIFSGSSGRKTALHPPLPGGKGVFGPGVVFSGWGSRREFFTGSAELRGTAAGSLPPAGFRLRPPLCR